ncbi:hypothetical protein CSW59_19740 [Caulobacter sp. BP25]|nr:hypothetical protein CSW59_19740 [Caulobacter sp. BP25]
MKRFVRASLIVALAISSIPALSNAGPRFYRERIYYDMAYSPGTSPFPGPGPTPGGSSTRVEVGWDRYYCDGTVRSFGQQTGDFEDYEIGTCP